MRSAFDHEKINVRLTEAVLAETRWYLVDAETNVAVRDWIQVFASPQLHDVLLVKREDGDHWWYDDLLYAVGNPVAVAAFYAKWNASHGYAVEDKAPRASHRARLH